MADYIYPVLSIDDLFDLLSEIQTAEHLPLPGTAKQNLVITRQAAKFANSPPPDWIWLFVLLLEKLIPILLDYLHKKFGKDWPKELPKYLDQKKLPWQSP